MNAGAKDAGETLSPQAAIERIQDATIPADERLEFVASMLANMFNQTVGSLESNAELRARSVSHDAIVFSTLRNMRTLFPVAGEFDVFLNSVRTDSEKFVNFVSSNGLNLWDWVGGGELVAPPEEAVLERTQEAMKSALASGEGLEKGTCCEGTCSQPIRCTDAQRCLKEPIN